MSENSEVGVPREGEIIAGKYRVEKVLGVGGMGVVVAAQHVRLDEKVALKFLLPETLSNAEAVARFEREARAASKIKSEHVARVSDVGTLDNGSPYMVMEFLEGSDLGGWLEKHGPMPVSQAVDFVLQASEALADAHTLGIVHRDLKPANLFCIQRTDGQYCIKVLDFGISKLNTPGGDSVSMTRTTAILGSPLYMSPEQMMMSKGVDARSDIWSLGTILFELVTGQPPFNADTVTELAIRIATFPHTPVASLRPDAPPGFAQLITRCLEKDREKRFQTVAELAVALGEFAPAHARLSIDRVVGTLQRAGGVGAGNITPPAGSPGAARTGVGPETAASWGQTDSPPAPGKPPVAAIVGAGVFVVLAIAAGLGMIALRRPSVATVASAVPSAAEAPSAAASNEGSAVAAAPPATSVAAADPATPPATPEPPAPSQPAHSPPHQAVGAPPPPAQHAAQHAPAAPAVSAQAPPKANCNPPYVVNAAGEHEYKPECLR